MFVKHFRIQHHPVMSSDCLKLTQHKTQILNNLLKKKNSHIVSTIYIVFHWDVMRLSNKN